MASARQFGRDGTINEAYSDKKEHVFVSLVDYQKVLELPEWTIMNWAGWSPNQIASVEVLCVLCHLCVKQEKKRVKERRGAASQW